MKETNLLIVFYSTYGHVHQMAKAEAEGAGSVDGVEVTIKRVRETLPPEVLEKMGAVETAAAMKDIPEVVPDDLLVADAILFGTPTRFGNMCGQMRQFLDSTGSLWQRGGLVGKVGSVFASTGTQHGGQETTITSFHTTLFHHGMIVVGVPYAEPRLIEMGEITGGTPYGATTMAGPDGSRMPTENELEIAKYQGRHVAEIAKKLSS